MSRSVVMLVLFATSESWELSRVSSGGVKSGVPCVLHIFTTAFSCGESWSSQQVVATEESMAVRLVSMLDSSCEESASVLTWAQVVPGGSL